jgi:hypothetical protein
MFDPDFYRFATNAARPLVTEPHPDQPMADHIRENFGCHGTATRQLVEMILGRELPQPTRKTNKIGITPGLVFTHANNSEIYAVIGVDHDGNGSNFISTTQLQPFNDGPTSGYLCPTEFNEHEVSIATEEQVETFLKAIGLVK